MKGIAEGASVTETLISTNLTYCVTPKDLVMRALFGAPALLGVLGVTTALTLAGRFKMWLVKATAGSPVPIHEDCLVQWVMFNEIGGRWLIPIAVGIACVAVRQPATFPRRDGG